MRWWFHFQANTLCYFLYQHKVTLVYSVTNIVHVVDWKLKKSQAEDVIAASNLLFQKHKRHKEKGDSCEILCQPNKGKLYGSIYR